MTGRRGNSAENARAHTTPAMAPMRMARTCEAERLAQVHAEHRHDHGDDIGGGELLGDEQADEDGRHGEGGDGHGMSTAAPTAQPTMFEIVQELWENRFTMSARSTDQLPSAKRAVFTP